jgi:hypothetical protein
MTASASVVVVHGLWMPGVESWLLRRRLAAEGFVTRSFRYASVSGGLAEGAARLAEFAAATPGERLHFVGHSLGGVLILEMLARHGCERLGRVVCLGSPLCGSRAAVALLGWPGGRRILGTCMGEVVARGGCGAWNGVCEVGVIAGSLPVGFGRLLVGSFGGPHDGTVAVDETRLEGVADHVVLPVSHFSMLWSAGVARHVASFLRSGRFASVTAS